MPASFFYCHGTNYWFNIMVPFIDSIVSLDQNLVFRVFNKELNPNSLTTATIAGLNGKTYTWDLTPANDPFPTMLDPELWDERVMVAYPASIIAGGASIDDGINRMKNKILAMPKGKKFAIGGFSQGAAVASGVYLLGLKPGTTGPLESRRNDFLGAVNFGNPRRQVNHRGAGGQYGTFSGSWYDPDMDLGAGGCFPDTGPWARLTGCEDKWVEFVAPGETITGNGTSLVESRWQTLSGVFLGSFDVPSFLQAVTAETFGAVEIVSELLAGDGFGRVLPNFFLDAAGATRNVGGGGHTQYAVLPPPLADGTVPSTTTTINGTTYYSPVGDTSYQCALKFLNSQAQTYQTAASVVPPTITTGWSTTLIRAEFLKKDDRMKKHLRIEVNGMEWVNGDFAEIVFTDGPTGVKIEGKPVRTAPNGGNGLLDLLASASRTRTQAVADEKRTSMSSESVEVVEAEPVEQD